MVQSWTFINFWGSTETSRGSPGQPCNLNLEIFCTICTTSDLWQYHVLPFGLHNAQVTIQHLMDIFLWLYLHYTTATKMGSKHLMYLWKVLEALKDTVLPGISLMRPLEKKKLLHQHSLYLYHVFLERANVKQVWSKGWSLYLFFYCLDRSMFYWNFSLKLH